MNALAQFLHYLYALQTADGPCAAVMRSHTYGVPDTILYGGNCLQAFTYALYSHGSVMWEYLAF